MVGVTSIRMSSLYPQIPGICKLTSSYPKYQIEVLPIPSSSNSLSRGWISRAICSQSPELTLAACTPELISAITSHPLMMTGVSLDHPTKQVMESRFKKGTSLVTSHFPYCLAIFMCTVPGQDWGWECTCSIVALVGCSWLGGGHIPSAPPKWFKADAWVGHSWAHPWHLILEQELVSTVGCPICPDTGSSVPISISVTLLTPMATNVLSKKTTGLS